MKTAGPAEIHLGARTPIDITFDNRGDRLLALGVRNALLKTLTLGIYSAWAKTEVRRRLWSFTKLNGEPLEYTGTGRELFLGLLIAMAVVVLPAILGAVAVAVAFGGDKQAIAVYQFALYVIFLLLIGNAIYRAWRYRLSRTRWRSIRGALLGSPGTYGWTYFWTLAVPLLAAIAAGAAVTALTLPALGGVTTVLALLIALWVLPWRANLLRRIMTEQTRFGDTPLSYDGTAGPLYKAYGLTWLALVAILVSALAGTVAVMAAGGYEPPALGEQLVEPPLAIAAGIVLIWIAAGLLAAVTIAAYRARQIQHFASHTHLDGATFKSQVTGRGLAWITLSNYLLTMLAIVLAVAAAAAAIWATGLMPSLPTEPDAEQLVEPFAAAEMMRVGIGLLMLILFTTVATTFAQFRSARYLMSRLKLDGGVDISAIAQSQAALPKRGEGLAQVFDVDAF